MDSDVRKISRRSMLKAMGAVAAGSALAACGGAARLPPLLRSRPLKPRPRCPRLLKRPLRKSLRRPLLKKPLHRPQRMSLT